jgi:DNA topoisomerase VI subunit A
MIRHFTSIDNVKNGKVVDPFKIKHGVVTALKISHLSGWIDPQTHLNIDFPEHLVKVVNVAEELSIGSRIVLESERFMFAYVDPRAYRHFGAVNEIERIEQLKEVYHRDFGNK